MPLPQDIQRQGNTYTNKPNLSGTPAQPAQQSVPQFNPAGMPNFRSDYEAGMAGLRGGRQTAIVSAKIAGLAGEGLRHSAQSQHTAAMSPLQQTAQSQLNTHNSVMNPLQQTAQSQLNTHNSVMNPLMQTQQTETNLGLRDANTRRDANRPLYLQGLDELMRGSSADRARWAGYEMHQQPSNEQVLDEITGLPKPAFLGETEVIDNRPGASPKKDTKLYKLAKGEAVLNAGAAEMMGREEIAALNAQGAERMGLRAGGKPEMKDGVMHAVVGDEEIKARHLGGKAQEAAFAKYFPNAPISQQEIRAGMANRKTQQHILDAAEDTMRRSDAIYNGGQTVQAGKPASAVLERSAAENFGRKAAEKVKGLTGGAKLPGWAGTAGKAIPGVVAGLDFADQANNGYVIEDEGVPLRGPTQALMDAGATASRMVDIVPGLLGKQGTGGRGYFESKYDDALRGMAEQQGVKLSRRQNGVSPAPSAPAANDLTDAQWEALSYDQTAARQGQAAKMMDAVRERAGKEKGQVGLRSALMLMAAGGDENAMKLIAGDQDLRKAGLAAGAKSGNKGTDRNLSVGDQFKIGEAVYGEGGQMQQLQDTAQVKRYKLAQIAAAYDKASPEQQLELKAAHDRLMNEGLSQDANMEVVNSRMAANDIAEDGAIGRGVTHGLVGGAVGGGLAAGLMKFVGGTPWGRALKAGGYAATGLGGALGFNGFKSGTHGVDENTPVSKMLDLRQDEEGNWEHPDGTIFAPDGRLNPATRTFLSRGG